MEVKRCGAKRRNGEPCQKFPINGRARCRLHGGLTPTGPALPQWKTGEQATRLPPNLKKLYVAALNDAELLKIRHDVARASMLMTDLDSKLKDGQHVTEPVRKQMIDLMDLRRKLIAEQAKILRDLEQMIPAERFVQAMTASALITGDVLREICTKTGEDADFWLNEVRLRFDRLRLPVIESSIVEGETT